MTATLNESASLDRACAVGLMEAVQKYFDIIYDCDTSRFDQVFRSTVQLHGFRDGQMVAWPAQEYRDILDKRQSPKSLNAARGDEILLIDFASTTQAFTKVRVRVNTMVFVDYLTWHRIDGKWLITSKGFHVESSTGEI
ncbi:MAG: nuclear transport factor 2 family protein [Pseudomonadota bacterium]